jgi:hypothetical protein
MRTFILTSQSFDGEVFFHYVNEKLVKFSCIDATLSEIQHAYILAHLPLTVSMLENCKSPTSKIAEINPNITFEMFWNRYDDKQNSSKKKTQTKWNKMPATEQVKAFNHITRYFVSIPAGIRKKYAETYLNAELWNN